MPRRGKGDDELTTAISIVIAILAFSLIVIVHEAGHLIAAKKNGIMVEEFAIGMGPKLIGKQLGETLYTIRAFPIGGFCRMLGEDEVETDPRAFGNKKPMARFVVIVAGALMNFVLGLVLIFILISLVGFGTTEIYKAPEGQPAYEAGLREGDEILTVDGARVQTYEDLLFQMFFAKGEPMAVKVRSGDVEKTVNITPGINAVTGRYALGVQLKTYSGLWQEPQEGATKATLLQTLDNTGKQFLYYGRTVYMSLKMLIAGEVSPKDMSGVVGISDIYVESIQIPLNTVEVEGKPVPMSERVFVALMNVLDITILITVNLGIMNLLPFPALDGGRAVFILLEAIRRKPIDKEKEGMIHFAGFVLLMGLMLFVTYNDVARIITGA